MYVETFIHPDGRVFTLSTEELGNRLILHTIYISTIGEVISGKEEYDGLSLASEYRLGILNMLKWSGFLASHNLSVAGQ